MDRRGEAPGDAGEPDPRDCHGRGAQGAFGYPNLRDDSWLWGDGTLAAIHKTILHGIRSGDPDTQTNQMPAFGRTGVLNESQIADVAEYTLSLSGKSDDKAADERGAKIFATTCTPCHGADGKGNPKLGAPNLTDELWLYAGDKQTIMADIRNGRGGVMPTTSHGWPLSVMLWPTRSSRPPKRPCHNS